MTLGEKLKNIRKRFGLSQEKLSKMIYVSRQAITKWENDMGIPDSENLKSLSELFGISTDYLLKEEISSNCIIMYKKLDKNKYKNKINSYSEILKEYYNEPYEVYSLMILKNLNKTEQLLDLLSGGNYSNMKQVSDLSPYYLVKIDDLKLLVNIKNWTLNVRELPQDINEKKFIIDDNKFIKMGRIKF